MRGLANALESVLSNDNQPLAKDTLVFLGMTRIVSNPDLPKWAISNVDSHRMQHMFSRQPEKHGNPAVSVVIVNLNGLRHLEYCLESVSVIQYPNLEIICVDNGSIDGSVQQIRTHFPHVVLIENRTNRGYGAGINAGICASRGEYILALNNDVEVHPEFVTEMLTAMDSATGVGMGAAKVLIRSQRDYIDSVGHVLYPDGLNFCRGHLSKDNGQYNRVEEVSHPSGCAAFLRRAMLDEIGSFDESFFMYGEDVDLGLRARLAGWRCLFVPTALAYHASSATAGRYSRMKAFYVERNRVWIAVKCLPPSMLALSTLFTLIRWSYQAYGALFRVGAAGEFRNEHGLFGLAVVFCRAYVSAISGLPKMLRARWQIQGRAKVSASDVVNLYRRFGISARDLALSK